MTTYQTHNKISYSTNAIAERKNYSDKLAQMRAEGTYCDNEDPDLSFLNFRASCKQCPNYLECKKESEERSRGALKIYRTKRIKKPKTKRKIKGGK